MQQQRGEPVVLAPGRGQVQVAAEGRLADEPARRAGVVHLGGTFAEIAEAERAVAEGRPAERPFVLVGQQYVADPGRSRNGVHPVDLYGHVPHAYAGDATEAVDLVHRILREERDLVISARPLRPTTFEVDGLESVA